MRYQIWRGPRFFEAFEKAHIGTRRYARRAEAAVLEFLRGQASEPVTSNVTERLDGGDGPATEGDN
jgi:hypothetical protein